jgi:hypothetical protein
LPSKTASTAIWRQKLEQASHLVVIKINFQHLAKHKSPTHTVTLGTGFRRPAWNSSSNENSTQRSPVEPNSSVSTSSDTGESHPSMTTVVEVNNLLDDAKHRKPAQNRHFNFKESDK